MTGGGRAAPEIRPAVAADERALTAIDAATRSPAVTPAPDPPPGWSLFADGGRARPENTLVALVGGRPAGFCALAAPTPLESNRHVLEVCELAVAPEHQGRGLGRALVEAAAAQARARGARRLRLRVLATNDRARRLYESCGFEVEGVLRGEFALAGALVDDLLLARDLTATRA